MFIKFIRPLKASLRLAQTVKNILKTKDKNGLKNFNIPNLADNNKVNNFNILILFYDPGHIQNLGIFVS